MGKIQKLILGALGAATAVFTGYRVVKNKKIRHEQSRVNSRNTPMGTRKVNVDFFGEKASSGNLKQRQFGKIAKETNAINSTDTLEDAHYDEHGYDSEGFNRDGFDKQGFNREGYNKKGFDRLGLDREGLDSDGYNLNFFNVYSVDRSGRNIESYLDRIQKFEVKMERAKSLLRENKYDYALYDTRKTFEEILRLIIGHYLGPKSIGEGMLDNLKTIQKKIFLLTEEELNKAHGVRIICNKVHEFEIEDTITHDQAHFAVMQTFQLVDLAKRTLISGERDAEIRRKTKRGWFAR